MALVLSEGDPFTGDQLISVCPARKVQAPVKHVSPRPSGCLVGHPRLGVPGLAWGGSFCPGLSLHHAFNFLCTRKQSPCSTSHQGTSRGPCPHLPGWVLRLLTRHRGRTPPWASDNNGPGAKPGAKLQIQSLVRGQGSAPTPRAAGCLEERSFEEMPPRLLLSKA